MERDLEKDLIEIECAIKSQEEKGNIFTMSILQRCHKLVSELQEYKALEEEGKLLKLPCMIGDLLYIINPKNLKIESKHTVEGFRIYEDRIMVETKIGDGLGGFLTDALQFGKYAFLSKEEAEKGIKEILR